MSPRDFGGPSPEEMGVKEKKGEIEAGFEVIPAKPETKPAMPPLARGSEPPRNLQLATVVSEIQAGISSEMRHADESALSRGRERLVDLPYLPADHFHQILDYDGVDEGVMMVATDAIVGSVSPAFRDWSTEYDDRRGRSVAVAQELIRGTPESIDHVFHVSDPRGGIKLKKVSGPAGDLFFVVDGTHRVAGSKLVGLHKLPARVENMTNLSEVHTEDPGLKSQWEKRIERGLIQGTVEETTTTSGSKRFNLKIKSETLPWMHLPQPALVEMTKLYFARYPEAREKMTLRATGEKIPLEALLDDIALSFYLADKWNEYKPNA